MNLFSLDNQLKEMEWNEFSLTWPTYIILIKRSQDEQQQTYYNSNRID